MPNTDNEPNRVLPFKVMHGEGTVTIIANIKHTQMPRSVNNVYRSLSGFNDLNSQQFQRLNWQSPVRLF